MKKPKISIVVPVYNVEKEIHRCITSLINQTLNDIEIILVNDGSPDNCPQICDEYAIKDKRIKVIHKQNGGQADARNVGLIKSTGEYIFYVDSDDYISLEACEVLYSRIDTDLSLDIIVGDAIKIDGSEKVSMKHSNIESNTIFTGPDFLKHQLKYKSLIMAVWFNIYKRDFLIENNLFFKTGIYHEDEEWVPRVFLSADKVKYVESNIYYYVIREGSTMTQKNKLKNGVDLMLVCHELEKLYKNLEDKDLKDLLYDYLSMLFLNAIHFSDLYDKKYNHLYSKRFLIGKPKSTRNKLKAVLFILNKRLYKYFNNLSKKNLGNMGN